MSEPFVHLFVNARAGRRARQRIGALRTAFESRGATVLVSESASSRLEIDQRSDHVCSVGGDGTLRHVVDALHRSGRSASVSAYPGGTVNLLARECGYPRSPAAFVERVLGAGSATRHYTALVGDTPLLTCASVGPDSFAVEALSATLKGRIGRFAYVAAFCRQLIRWRRVSMTLSDGERRLTCEAVYVAKGRFFAGPWSFAPQAKLGEPSLHVVVLRKASRWHFVRFAWALLVRRPIETLDFVERFTCAELTMASDARPPLQADGDIVAHLPTTISVRPAPTDFA